jgi:hypothetical protein
VPDLYADGIVPGVKQKCSLTFLSLTDNDVTHPFFSVSRCNFPHQTSLYKPG